MNILSNRRAFVAFTLCLGLLSFKLNHHFIEAHQEYKAETPLYLLDQNSLNTPTLGYTRAIADLLWMQTLAYFGTHYAGDRDYRYLYHMLNIVTHLNPHDEPAYHMAASILPWLANASEASIQLLTRAMVQNPEEGVWPYYLGLNLYLFENNKIAAMHYLNRAIRLNFAPGITAVLAARLKAETSGLSDAIQWLELMLSQSQDKSMRLFLEDQLNKVKTEATLRKLENIMARLQAAGIPTNDISTLKRHIRNWPARLSDGGIVVMNKKGQLISSKSPIRFRLYQSNKTLSRQ